MSISTNVTRIAERALTSLHGITPLRQRMIDDMRMRKFADKTQIHYFARAIGCESSRAIEQF